VNDLHLAVKDLVLKLSGLFLTAKTGFWIWDLEGRFWIGFTFRIGGFTGGMQGSGYGVRVANKQVFFYGN
jgi:hypothetical protein